MEDVLKKDCDELMERLSEYNVSPSEAQELSQRFLSMCHRVNHRLRDINNEMIKLSIMEKLAYKKAFAAVDPKANVSKAKAFASADKGYIEASIKLQREDNEKGYWKGVYDVSNNAHIFYKLLCRD